MSNEKRPELKPFPVLAAHGLLPSMFTANAKSDFNVPAASCPCTLLQWLQGRLIVRARQGTDGIRAPGYEAGLKSGDEKDGAICNISIYTG